MKNFNNLFEYLDEISPESDLKDKIIFRIQNIERNSSIRGFVVFSSLSLASLIGAFYSFFYLLNNFKESGIYNYLSLVFSENTGIVSYLKELTMSIVESLPFLGLALFLFVIAIFVWSSVRAIRDARVTFLTV